MAESKSKIKSAVSLVNDIAQKSLTSVLRSVSIHLTNNCKSNLLINPQVYTYSGYSYDPPQPTVKNGVTEVCAFGHEKLTPYGAVGVLTYDISNRQKRLAIMFSVPFDYASYENLFALGLFNISQACDQSLYDLMYNQEGSFTRGTVTGSEMTYLDGNFIMTGTMCPMSNAQMKVELWD